MTDRVGEGQAGPSDLERIVAAAIKVGPVVHTGPHHATIIHQIVACGGETPVRGAQGFMTSDGRFVGRLVGRKIAFAAGQIATDADSMLSEELWIVPEPNWAALRASEAALAEMTKDRDGWRTIAQGHAASLLRVEDMLATMTKERDGLRNELRISHATVAEWKEVYEASRAEATKAEHHHHFEADDRCPCGAIRPKCQYCGATDPIAAIRAPQPPEPEHRPVEGKAAGVFGESGGTITVCACGAPWPCPSSPPPPSELQERYARMGKEPWFKAAHEGKSLGERLPLPEEAPPPSGEPRCRCGGLWQDPHRPGCPEYVRPVPSPSPTREEPR